MKKILPILLLIFALFYPPETSPAADKTIDQFTVTTTIDAADKIPVWHSGTKAITKANFLSGTLDMSAATVTLPPFTSYSSFPCEFCVAASDETTAITTGTGKVTFRAPYAFTLTAVRASVNTAPTGSTILIDINESGTTVLSTKLMIDASEKTSTTATTAYVISDSAIADDAEISVDFDQVGSTIAGAGVKIWILGHR